MPVKIDVYCNQCNTELIVRNNDEIVLCSSCLGDYALYGVRTEYDPEDVFDKSQLEEWARDNGFTDEKEE